MPVKHAHVSAIPDDPTKDVSSNKWNADHTITLTKAELNAALSDGDVQFVGDAPTVHTHLLAAGATDVTITAANLNTLDDGTNTSLHFHNTDRARSNHTGTQLANTISDFDTAVAANAAVAANTAKQTNATHTGDVTGSGALTIAARAVTWAKVQAMTTARFLGRLTGGSGDVEELTAAQVTSALDTVTSGAKGLAPASGGGTTNFLRADGSWAAPAGGGGGSPGGSTTQVQYNNAGAFAGATEVEIEGNQLRLPAVTGPTAPAAGGVKLIGSADAGRTLPAYLSQDGIAHKLQSELARAHLYSIFAINNSTSLANTGLPAFTITGTATAASVLSPTSLLEYTPRVDYVITPASTSAVAGFRPGNGRVVTVGGASASLGGFAAVLIWGPATGVGTATFRCCAGFSSTGAAPTDVEPSTQVNGVWMGWDAADTNIQIMHNDGSGTCTKVDLGASFPVPTADRTHLYELSLFSPKGTTQSVEYHVKDILTGAVATGVITTDLPGTGTSLGAMGYASAGGTSSVVGITFSSLVIDPLLD